MTDEESLTGIEQDVQIEERTTWSNVGLNKKFLSYATENVAAAVGHVQKLSRAKSLEEVVKIQTEFISKQLGSLNEQTKTIVETCTKAAQDVMKRSS
jgi:hypothetical protein